MNAFITANYAAVHGGFRGRGLSRFAQVRNDIASFNASVVLAWAARPGHT